jgi:predicted nucleic acid-binding protein
VRFLLDTNVVSELRKAGDNQADANVVAWAAALDGGDLYLSAVTIMELEIGVLSAEHRQRAVAKILRPWMDAKVLPEFAGRILPVDEQVALRCAALHVPELRPLADSLIAATALVHGMTVATRNVSHFKPTGALLVDPWKGP